MQSFGLNLFHPRNVIKSIFHLLRCYLTSQHGRDVIVDCVMSMVRDSQLEISRNQTFACQIDSELGKKKHNVLSSDLIFHWHL